DSGSVRPAKDPAIKPTRNPDDFDARSDNRQTADGSRTSREDSVSVHIDGVINNISAKPYGNTCSGQGRRGCSNVRRRQTVIPLARRSLILPRRYPGFGLLHL